MIRAITTQDRDLYLSLMDEFYHSSAVLHPVDPVYCVRAVDEILAQTTYLLGYLLEHEGSPAGYAMLARAYSTECGGPVLWIEELYVREQYRSKGLGREFFAFLEREFSGSVCRFRLEVEPDNVGAQSLYRRLGFEILPYTQMVKEFPH